MAPRRQRPADGKAQDGNDPVYSGFPPVPLSGYQQREERYDDNKEQHDDNGLWGKVLGLIVHPDASNGNQFIPALMEAVEGEDYREALGNSGSTPRLPGAGGLMPYLPLTFTLSNRVLR